MGRDNNFYQKVGNIGVYVVFFELRTYSTMRSLLQEHIDDTDVDHQFFLVHYPIYSRGSTPYIQFELYAAAIEGFLDGHPNHRIRSIITGHDHLFSLFNRSNVFVLVNAPSGGDDETKFKEFQPDNPRYFTGTLEGPLKPIGLSCHGWEWHVYSCLWSYMKVKTYIDILEDRLVYTLVDMTADSVIRKWD